MIDETIRIDGSGTFSSGSGTMRGNQDPNALARVDKYILLETLGSGSFGVVYRARDTFSPAEYALKLIPALRTADDGYGFETFEALGHCFEYSCAFCTVCQ